MVGSMDMDTRGQKEKDFVSLVCGPKCEKEAKVRIADLSVSETYDRHDCDILYDFAFGFGDRGLLCELDDSVYVTSMI